VASNGDKGRGHGACPRLLIADDHVLARAGLRTVLEEAGFDVAAEAVDSSGAVRAALEETPDLCLLAVRMPGDPFDSAAEIKRRLPSTKIVMMNAPRKDPDLFAAVEAGAMGYLLEDLDPQTLGRELDRVLDGEATLPPALALRLMEEFRRREQRGWAPFVRRRDVELTSREWDVLELMRDKLATAEIGRRLHISPTTVRRHVGAILRKLDVPSR